MEDKELLNEFRLMALVVFLALVGLFYVMFKHNIPQEERKALKSLNFDKIKQLENQVSIK